MLVPCVLAIGLCGCARIVPIRENNFETASRFLDDTPPCITSTELLAPAPRSHPGCPPAPPTPGHATGMMPLVPGRIVVPPSTTGPIPSTSPMLTPPRGSTATPGGGFYPMR